MRLIYKYLLTGELLESDGRFSVDIKMPADPRPLRVGLQGETPTLWAEVESTNVDEKARFWLIGTGREIPREASYIGTIDIGPLVWHVYGPVGMKVPK